MSIPSPMGISLRCLIVFFCLSFSLFLFCLRLWRPGEAEARGSRQVDPVPSLGERRSERVGTVPYPAAGAGLLAEPEALDRRAIALDVLPLEVVEQAAAAAHQLQKATAAVVILRVDLEVLGELRDPVRQEGHLDLGRSGVALVHPVPFDDVCFHFCGLRQSKLLLT